MFKVNPLQWIPPPGTNRTFQATGFRAFRIKFSKSRKLKGYPKTGARAPEGLGAGDANRIFNQFIAEPGLPLTLYHDHFIGQLGALAIFFVETTAERDALLSQEFLKGWQVECQPLIFSYSPAAFDEQIAFTLKAYRGVNWERLQKEQCPSYGNPSLEAETAHEED